MKHLIKTFIGVDPGYKGAIAVYAENEVQVIKNPKKFPEILDVFREIKANKPNILIAIEKVGMNPSDLNEPGKAFGIQKMVTNFNDFVNSFDALQIPYIKISPQKWQRGLNLYVKGEDKKARKNRYKKYAKDNFKTIKVTEQNQDALCILRYLFQLAQYDRSFIEQNTNNYDALVHLNECDC